MRRDLVIENFRRAALNQLFIYVFMLRSRREPAAWEIALGRSLIQGALEVVDLRPEEGSLVQVWQAAEAVRLALKQVEDEPEAAGIC